MKVFLIGGGIAIVLVIIAGLIFYTKQAAPSTTTPATSPTIAPSPTSTPDASSSAKPSGSPAPSGSGTSTAAFCIPTNLQAQISLSPGAGNVFGTATIANNGKTTCQILGGNSLQIGYDPSITNIHVSLQGATMSNSFTIAPGKSVYSQIHYPNGPQCQGAPVNKNITISYKISTTDVISFRALDGTTTFSVPTCTDPTEITEIQTWPISATPITP